MVTEGYKGVPPQPPTPGGSPLSHQSLRNFTVFFAHGVQKHRVLRCFGPFGVSEFFFGTIKKPCVLRGFGVPGGPRNGKNDMLKVFSTRWAKFVDIMGQHRAKIGPT